MSFGGAVSAMITSLKNNSRDRKTLYDYKDLYKTKSKNKIYVTDKKATPEQLERIRTEMRAYNRKYALKLYGMTILGVVLLIGMFLFISGIS